MLNSRLWQLIRNRLALRYLLVLAIILTIIQLLFGAFQVYSNYRQQLNDLENQADIQAKFLASVGVEHVLTNNFFVLERLVRQTNNDPDIVYATILSADGRALTRYLEQDDPIIAEIIAQGTPVRLPEFFDSVNAHGLVETKRELLEAEGIVVGEVRLGYSLQSARQRLINSALTTLAATLAAIIVLAGLTLLIFNWFIGRPLQEVGTLAQRFAAGDLSQRAFVEIPDEIGQLKMAFNIMAGQLEETLAGLHAATAEARKLSQVASRTSNQVIITDPAGNIEWVNVAFEESTGYTFNEVQGKRPGDLLQGPASDPDAIQYMHDRLEEKLSFNCEIINYTKDRTPYWVSIDVQPVYDDDDELVNFIAVETDITERKETERVLRRRAEIDSLISEISTEFINYPSLQTSQKVEEILEPLAEEFNAEYAAMELFADAERTHLSTEALWIREELKTKVETLSIRAINPQSQWGRTLDSGRPVVLHQLNGDREDSAAYPPEMASFLQENHFQSLIIMPISWSGTRRGQLTLGAIQTAQTWNHETITALEMVSDIVASALQRKAADNALSEERTALRHRTAELRTANAALAEASNAKDAFWASMSHELRTPLNVILGFVQLMDRDHDVTPQQREHLSIIRNSGNHLLGLINDVLSLAKIEAGRMTLTQTNFDLYILLGNLERMFGSRMVKKGLQFAIVRETEIPQFVRTDQGKVRQILFNLLDNAIKFTEEGSVVLAIGYREPEPRLFFRVEDTGVGIKEAELTQLFEPFTQTESGIESKSGTGLGLSLCRQFVRMMGGDIAVNSAVGQGSRFSFEINIELATSAVETNTGSGRQIIQLAKGQPNYRILVAEDLEDNQLLMQEVLGQVGFDVQIAVDGQQAIDMARTWQPHLILMDIRMPVLDGYEATRQIRQDPAIKEIPIVAVTASALEHQQIIALDAGCNAVLHKPIQIDILFDAIAKYTDAVYIYDESDDQMDEDQPQAGGELSSESFAILPQALVEEIHRAASMLDTAQLQNLCEEVRTHNAQTADIMLNLINDFDVEKIIELTANNV